MSPQTVRRPIRVSFEFFPPKSPAMEEGLWRAIQRLAPLDPHFVSVTYGAGGSTRERTHQTIRRLFAETELKPAAHLTCVDASKGEVDEVVRQYRDTGVRHFVALRGDSTDGPGSAYVAHESGYRNAIELTEGLKSVDPELEISVSAYPEKHPESPDFATDIDFLKRKVEAGASRAITQFFFDNDHYERYVERVRRAGIYVPIVPGIVPIHDFQKIAKFSAATGATIPGWLADRFEGLEDDPQTRSHVAASVCAEQVLDLVDRGVSDFHFYTMNRADLVYSICHILGLRPREQSTTLETAAA